MKRIIIIAAMALMSVSAFAQKFAYVDFNELVMLMPEMDEARATLEENSKTNEEILMSMYEEYQTKMQQYEQKASTWTQSVREIKEKEIMEIKGLAPGPQIKKCQDYLMALAFNNPLMSRDEAVKFLKGFRL